MVTKKNLIRAYSCGYSLLFGILALSVAVEVKTTAFCFLSRNIRVGRHCFAPVVVKGSSKSKARTSHRSVGFHNGDGPQKQPKAAESRPIPAMPSELFQQLALSQLELLANSLRWDDEAIIDENKSKIKSMALYLPQENVKTGQLEFLPAVIYPHPSSERVFIAGDSKSGFAPTLPNMLSKLPGFAAPSYLLPRYPMVSSTTSKNSTEGGEGDLAGVGVGVVEEVLCDVRSGAPALSVPLFIGSQTVGVLLVSPAVPVDKNVSRSRRNNQTPKQSSAKSNNQRQTGGGPEKIWTSQDREQIARAARTLAMALSMDMERTNLELKNREVQNALSDSLHQVKNPLQALRTFGKLLQRRVATVDGAGTRFDQVEVGTTLQLLELTRNLMEQSDRVVNLLAPIDSLVDSLDNGSKKKTAPPFYLNPVPGSMQSSQNRSLVPWAQAHPPALPWESETIEFARRETPQRGEKASSRHQIKAKLKPSNSSLLMPAGIGDLPKGNDRSTIEFSRQRGRGPTEAVKSSSNQGTQKRKSTSSPSFSSQLSQPTQSPPTVVGDDDDLEMSFVLDVLEPIFSMYAAIGEERGISFHVVGLERADEFPGVLIRRKALQEAVSNVLDNAFKYVVLPKQANMEAMNPNPLVRIRLLANDDTLMPVGVTLIVEDNGPGVIPEEAGAIFERGFRSPSISSLAGGTGIGLDISRTLLESMGGRLECFVRTSRKGERGANSSLRPNLLDGGVFRILLFRDRK